MQKYDLEAIPVVDAMGRLVGRITIIKYYWRSGMKRIRLPIGCGISKDVEADDSVLVVQSTFTWLVLALWEVL
jgi:magnesium transporter